MAEHDTGSAGDDRRKSARIGAHDLELRVLNAIDDEPLGVIGNLSLGGMMLITRRELLAEGVLQLRIEAPGEGAESAISLGVRVLWCTPANSPHEYWVGLETIDIGEAEAARLGRLLDHIGQRD